MQHESSCPKGQGTRITNKNAGTNHKQSKRAKRREAKQTKLDDAMKKEKYRKGIFLVVYKRNNEGETEYLLLRRKLHWRGWEFPKGGIERGEKIRRAVLRELKEETGLNPLKITKHRKRGRYKYGSKLQDREGVTGQSYLLYSIEGGAGVVKIDKVEHSGSKWAGFKKAMRLLTWPNQRACLSIVNKSLKSWGFESRFTLYKVMCTI